MASYKSQPPTLTVIRSKMADAGHVWFSKPLSVNVVGYRTKDLQANTFNDWMTVSWLDEHDMWFFRRWPCTTDPGVYWRKDPMNRNGTAIVKPDQYRAMWKLGLFRGRYEALVQNAKCTVWRDNDKNETIDVGPDQKEQTGRFGICCHRAGDSRIAKKVNRFSAGCQVLPDPNHFDEFMAIIRMSMAVFGPTVSYSLVTE